MPKVAELVDEHKLNCIGGIKHNIIRNRNAPLRRAGAESFFSGAYAHPFVFESRLLGKAFKPQGDIFFCKSSEIKLVLLCQLLIPYSGDLLLLFSYPFRMLNKYFLNFLFGKALRGADSYRAVPSYRDTIV